MTGKKWVPYRQTISCGTCGGTGRVPCWCRPFCREEKTCSACGGAGTRVVARR
jgi:DnaJ-class molecular chaperone